MILKLKIVPFVFLLKGREKDVAIFSCVRANDKGEIGFLSNSHRMNVGITRAKSSVLVKT